VHVPSAYVIIFSVAFYAYGSLASPSYNFAQQQIQQQNKMHNNGNKITRAIIKITIIFEQPYSIINTIKRTN